MLNILVLPIYLNCQPVLDAAEANYSTAFLPSILYNVYNFNPCANGRICSYIDNAILLKEIAQRIHLEIPVNFESETCFRVETGITFNILPKSRIQDVSPFST